MLCKFDGAISGSIYREVSLRSLAIDGFDEMWILYNLSYFTTLQRPNDDRSITFLSVTFLLFALFSLRLFRLIRIVFSVLILAELMPEERLVVAQLNIRRRCCYLFELVRLLLSVYGYAVVVTLGLCDIYSSSRSYASAEYWIHLTRSRITPPKVNWFGWNLEHSEFILGAGPGRFWARSAQKRELGSQAKFIFVR